MSINSIDGGMLRWRERCAGVVARLAFAVTACRPAMQEGRQRRRTMGRLAGLSDHALKDLGIHRSEVGSIAHWNGFDRTRRRDAGGRPRG